MQKKRVTFRIQLTTDAKKQLVNFSEPLGITQIAMMSKLVEWFAAQPEVVQAAVLNLYPESIRRDVARLILEKVEIKPRTRES